MQAHDWLTTTPATVILTGAALALLLWTAAGVYGRYRASAAWVSPVPPAVQPARRAPAATLRVSDIIGAHLFGRPALKAKAPAEAPQTRLQLKLLGVVASDRDPAHARAIIQVEKGRAKTYRVGEPIEDTDARLEAVEAKRVLLDRNGVTESLPLVMEAVPEPAVGGRQPKSEGSKP